MAAKKNITAAITIEGPEGVSICNDAHKPSPTEAMPISAPPSAICSGVLLKRLAAETGIIKSEVTSRIPIIFMDKAITAAIKSMKISCTLITGTPSAWASSLSNVRASKGRQSQRNISMIKRPPP